VRFDGREGAPHCGPRCRPDVRAQIFRSLSSSQWVVGGEPDERNNASATARPAVSDQRGDGNLQKAITLSAGASPQATARDVGAAVGVVWRGCKDDRHHRSL